MLDRSIVPETHSFGRLTLPECEVTVLPNGLTLHLLSGGEQDVARLSIIADGGPSDISRSDAASICAKLLCEGSKSIDGAAMADLIDFNGAWLSGNASGHFTTLRLSALTSKFDAVLAPAIDSFVNPAFERDAFEALRQKAAASRRIDTTKVSWLASTDNLALICGPSHPDAQYMPADEIERLTRDDIIKFHGLITEPRNIHAYLAGKLSVKLIDTVAGRLGGIPSQGLVSPVKIVPYSPEEPCRRTVARAGALQSAVVMSMPSIKRDHPDYNALRMTVTALGGYFGSRLMLNVREDKGLTYGISAALCGSREGAYVVVSSQCDNSFVGKVIDEVKSEIRHMADRPLTTDELTRLRANVSSDLASTIDSPFTMIDHYEIERLVGTPSDYFERRQQTLASLSPELICEMARKYLDVDRLRISVAGDTDKIC